MKKYSLGFAFDEAKKHLVVITKNRPAAQAGKWNGVGGHIEDGESPIACVVREFLEETGIHSQENQWSPLCVFGGENYEVYVFIMKSEDIYQAQTMTDERINIIRVDLNEIKQRGQSNLPWLVGMAIDENLLPIDSKIGYSC